MSFSEIDRINLVTKSLAAGVIDSNSLSQWYETVFPFTFMLNADKILVELDTVRGYPAGNIAQARVNAALIPTVLQDLSQHTSAVRLTEVVDTNGASWAAYSVYGDYSSPVLNNWMQPQLVPQANGLPSNGYGILLYNGDPNNGGTLISTTAYISGSGVNRSVSWFWNYSNGMLLVSADFLAGQDFAGGNFDPYILGFRYVGKTVGAFSSDIEVLTEDLATLENSFNTFQISVEAQIAALSGGSANVTVSDVGGGTSIGSFENDEIKLKTVKAGEFITISEEADGSLKISAEGGSRSGMISRFVKGG